MARKILFIVEGQNDEPDLIKQLYSVCLSGKDDTYEFYVFDTNIHQLAPLLMNGNNIDEDLDLLLVLKSVTRDPEQRKLLSQKYSDIYLIFDYDPQQRFVDLHLIHHLISHFTESTDMGKLFINYPMVQSFRHLSCLPDLNFVGKHVDHADVLHYKELVGKQALIELTQTRKLTYEIFISLTYHHLMQALYIQNDYTPVSLNEDNIFVDCLRIFDKQLEEWTQNNRCYVLNTSLFILIDYMPQRFFQLVSRHRESFRI